MGSRNIEIGELLAIPFLSGLPPADLEALVASGRSVVAEAGDLVFQAGEASSELCLLLDGEVAIELAVEAGPPRVLARLQPGTVFGEVGFLLGSSRTASARALRRARVLALTRDGLEHATLRGPLAAISLIEAVARILAMRLANVDRDLAEICGRIRREHPEAVPLLETIEERRLRVQHVASF